jgi:signal-transduction protein with cAMP-binding, CBS, and nucleotidyltransferase domain/DNA polymerase III epsilon subunit-like protein
MQGSFRPANHTALAALPAVVLDLETTGLDVTRDRVVQVGAAAMIGAKILEAPRLDQVIDPRMPIPPSATRIHGLRDEDVAGAPDFAAYAPTMREFIADRVVIGHNIAFDLAILRHEAARTGIAWRDPPALDLVLLAGALEPSLPDLSLETVARLLGVSIQGRHTALGDCLATAEAYARLLPRLRETDVRTLGEALALSARRTDLVLRQAQARWHAVPGEAISPPPAAPLTRIDSYIFERRLEDLMSAPPVVVDAQATLREAARTMCGRRVGAVLVGAAGRPPEGILTERDLLRAIAEGERDLDSARVFEAMTAPVETMSKDELLYRALGRMDRLRIRHLCVVDVHGAAAGMLSQRDLLHHRASAADVLGDALAEAHEAPALAAAYSQVPDAAARLVAEGLGGIDVARVVSNEVCGLTARAAEIAAARLAAEGRGPAPAPWCLMVLGSGGRGESLLGADQDNALIHAGGAADDPWFAEFGAQIATLLDEAGLARCKGGVMAANREWRGTVEDWGAKVDAWLRHARHEDLLHVDIFFDLVAVAGEASLSRALYADAVTAASHTPPFTNLLADWVSSLRPPLGMFGMLRTVEGRIDLKRGGLLPLVGIARTLALRAGSSARSTPDRLRDAATAGRIAEGDASTLIEMHADLLDFVLGQQLRDLEDGVRPSSRVVLKRLGKEGARRLQSQLHRLDVILGGLRGAVAS